jgi:hypothetical protein
MSKRKRLPSKERDGSESDNEAELKGIHIMFFEFTPRQVKFPKKCITHLNKEKTAVFYHNLRRLNMKMFCTIIISNFLLIQHCSD